MSKNENSIKDFSVNEYDVVVVGSGPAGENVAGRCTGAGLTAAIVERELVGGECSYWACMPSKALLRPGEALRVSRRTAGVEQAVTGAIDVDAVLARRDALASNWDDKYQVQWLEQNNITLYRGEGRLDGVKRVIVKNKNGEETQITAKKAVVIATGTSAKIPPIPGLKDSAPWDNRHITEAKSVPPKLLIVGGGVVGVEMAQAWKDLGSDEVTIVEQSNSLLAREEPFVGETIKKTFVEEYGINVMTDKNIKSVSRNVSGAVIVELSDGNKLVGDQILIAAGRQPLTQEIGLETVGLTPGDYIEVDDTMRAVNVEGGWLYAVGDVNRRALLTHTGKYQARIAGDVIAGKQANAFGDIKAVPRVVFTDPNVAAVGLTEAEARKSNEHIKVVEYGFGDVAGAVTQGKGIKGHVKIVVDTQCDIILGATFVGPGAGEMIHAATIAIVGEVTLDKLWHAVPAFPTISEVWLRLLEVFGK